MSWREGGNGEENDFVDVGVNVEIWGRDFLSW